VLFAQNNAVQQTQIHANGVGFTTVIRETHIDIKNDAFMTSVGSHAPST
jgi:hypothetical protein